MFNPSVFISSVDKSSGKTVLLKALLNLKDGENDTIEYLLDIAEKMGDLKVFVNAAYTDSLYKGQILIYSMLDKTLFIFV